MKKYRIYLLVLVFAACQPVEEKTFHLQGQVDGIDNGMVYLQDRVHGVMVNVDSAVIAGGNFTFSGSLDHPRMMFLRVNEIDPRLFVFMENEEMGIFIDPEQPADYEVHGSASHDILEEFNQLVALHNHNIREIQQKILEAEVMGLEEDAADLTESYHTTVESKQKAKKNFIREHNDQSVAVYLASRHLAPGMDGAEMTELVEIFDPSLEDNSYFQSLSQRADRLMQVAAGKEAPGFSMTNPVGEKISLEDFRGQYLLVSFWASWCPYCRQENPHLVGLYEKFQDQNFEILGVSLDRDKEAWLTGIEDDGLTWPQVSDLRGWQNEASTRYAVFSIPSNVLIDPEGVIIGRNMKVQELEEKLEKLLGLPA